MCVCILFIWVVYTDVQFISTSCVYYYSISVRESIYINQYVREYVLFTWFVLFSYIDVVFVDGRGPFRCPEIWNFCDWWCSFVDPMGITIKTQGLVGIILLWNQTSSLTNISIDDIRVVLALRKAPTDIYCDPILPFSTIGCRLLSPFSHECTPTKQAGVNHYLYLWLHTVGR